VDAISHEEWDATNAAFHEYQVDVAGNALLSRFYRDLSVNLMMQVIRGGRLEGGEYLVLEHTAIVEAFEAGDVEAAREAIRSHVRSGLRIALEALERAGGEL
jgi:DNA-binding GntR family transcriptional regulator